MMDEKTRICEDCGATFTPKGKERFCPECRNVHKRSSRERIETAEFRAYLRERTSKAYKAREARRARDYAWSSWEKENGVSDRVRVSGNAVVVSRGFIPAGFRSVGKVSNV